MGLSAHGSPNPPICFSTPSIHLRSRFQLAADLAELAKRHQLAELAELAKRHQLAELAELAKRHQELAELAELAKRHQELPDIGLLLHEHANKLLNQLLSGICLTLLGGSCLKGQRIEFKINISY